MAFGELPGQDAGNPFGRIGAYDPAMSDDPTPGGPSGQPGPLPAPETPIPDDLDDLDEREAARIRRRDRDAQAEQRELLRPGMGKVFKQILDAQRKAARSSNRRSGG